MTHPPDADRQIEALRSKQVGLLARIRVLQGEEQALRAELNQLLDQQEAAAKAKNSGALPTRFKHVFPHDIQQRLRSISEALLSSERKYAAATASVKRLQAERRTEHAQDTPRESTRQSPNLGDSREPHPQPPATTGEKPKSTPRSPYAPRNNPMPGTNPESERSLRLEAAEECAGVMKEIISQRLTDVEDVARVMEEIVLLNNCLLYTSPSPRD